MLVGQLAIFAFFFYAAKTFPDATNYFQIILNTWMVVSTISSASERENGTELIVGGLLSLLAVSPPSLNSPSEKYWASP